MYDGAEKANARMTGFVRDGDHWERFDEYRTPTLFPAPAVVAALQEAGWTRVWTASSDDLRSPVSDPEQFDRIFFVATSTRPFGCLVQHQGAAAEPWGRPNGRGRPMRSACLAE